MERNEHVYETLGRSVRARREYNGLTQDQLAKRIGLTRTSITNIEKGRQKIQVHVLCAIAEALDAPSSAFLPVSSSQRPEVTKGPVPNWLMPDEREWVERVLAGKSGSMIDGE